MKRQPKRTVQISRSRDRVLKYGNKNPITDGFPVEDGEPTYHGSSPKYRGLPLKNIPDEALQFEVVCYEDDDHGIDDCPECDSSCDKQERAEIHNECRELRKLRNAHHQLVLKELERRSGNDNS